MSTCSAPGCPRASRAGGLCSGHYKRARRGADLGPLGPPRPDEAMASLTVRVPQALLERLRARAEAAGHDLSAEVRARLERD